MPSPVTESLERIMEYRNKIDSLQRKIDAEMTHLIIADPEPRPRRHRLAAKKKKKQVVKKKLKRK